MEEFFHKHLIKFTLIITLPLWVAWAMADEVVGHTEHGIAITKEDLKIRSIRIDSIRSWEWIKETETLVLTLNRNKQVEIQFFNNCFDMPYATGLQFKTWGGFNSIGKGDSIIPITFMNTRSLRDCTIKHITEVMPA
jgi:hypothetical protein